MQTMAGIQQVLLPFYKEIYMSTFLIVPAAASPTCRPSVRHAAFIASLKGKFHQTLLSEMSLTGIEVLVEKLLPKILGRLG